MPLTLSDSQSLDSMGKRLWPLIEERHYQVSQFLANEEFTLTPPDPSKPLLHFKLVKDEVSLALHFLHGDGDLIYDTLSIAKTEWIKKNKGIRVYSHDGLGMSYLGFNYKKEILSNLNVRKAISEALPVAKWIEFKLFNWVTPIQAMNLPQYNPEDANQLLDKAGLKKQANGTRFTLRYYTTPVREGNETAQLVRESLKKISIEVMVITLETSLFFDKIKKGDYDLFSSKWIRFNENEPIKDLLSEKGIRNYTHYSNDSLQKRFEQNPNLTLSETKDIIADDLPFLPLYNWKHGLVLGDRVMAPDSISDSLDETFRFLSLLDLK